MSKEDCCDDHFCPGSRSGNKLLLLLAFALFLCVAFYSTDGCASKGTSIAVLATPKFVPQSQPDSIVQTGIRETSTGGIFLQWYAAEGAAGYEVYRSDTTNINKVPIRFSVVMNVPATSVLADTTAVDRNLLSIGGTYYYYLRAYSSDQTLSVASDTISYGILQGLQPTFPINNDSVSAGSFQFVWYDYTGGGYTVKRVRDITDVPSVYAWVSRRFKIFGAFPGSKPYDFDGSPAKHLVPGNSYQWLVERFDVDSTGRPYEGSTSAWATFTVK